MRSALTLLEVGDLTRRAGELEDVHAGVGASHVYGLAEFFRAVWRLGTAGVEVPLTLSRAGDVLHIVVKSADRNDFLRKPKLH